MGGRPGIIEVAGLGKSLKNNRLSRPLLSHTCCQIDDRPFLTIRVGGERKQDAGTKRRGTAALQCSVGSLHFASSRDLRIRYLHLVRDNCELRESCLEMASGDGYCGRLES
jgi:hypothetical protein